jgi:hypothetical protein
MNFTSKIEIYNNFLPENLFDEIEPFLRNTPKWTINRSNTYDDGIFWGIDLSQETLFNDTIFNFAKKKLNRNIQFNRIFANGQSTLQDGNPHTDSLLSNAKTLIIYANKKWDYCWGGYTVFFDRYKIENNETLLMSEETHSVFPFPNTAVYFPSNMFHCGLSPLKKFNGIRFTLVYQVKEIA